MNKDHVPDVTKKVPVRSSGAGLTAARVWADMKKRPLHQQPAHLRAALQLEALADTTRVVRAFGVNAAQAASVFAGFGEAVKKVDDESEALRAALRAKRPWYRRGRW